MSHVIVGNGGGQRSGYATPSCGSMRRFRQRTAENILHECKAELGRLVAEVRTYHAEVDPDGMVWRKAPRLQCGFLLPYLSDQGLWAAGID